MNRTPSLPTSPRGLSPRVVGLVAALALVAGAARGAPPPPGPAPKTRFRPSVDMLPVRNPSGRGTATGGSCHGIVEGALVYKAARDASGGRLPPLAELRAELEDRHGLDRAEALLRGLAVAEQHHVYQQSVQLVMTDASKRTVFENLKTSLDAGQPVRLSLASDSGEGHILVAYDYTRDADGDFVFRVGDPNAPGDDTRTITYVRGDPGAPIDSPDRVGAFEQYRGMDVLGVQAPLERQPERLVQMVEEARAGEVPRSDLVPPPGLELREEQQASAVDEPVVGGVLLRFPTSWYDPSQVPDPEYERLVGELRRFLARPRDSGVVVERAPRHEELVLVPIERLTAPDATTVGPLTRVRGWVRVGGALSLVGVVEPGREPIQLDLLSVALELLWRRGLTPAVSLDPDPQDLFGAQRARVVDVPAELHETALVRTMLAADYAMKELSLGARTTRVDRFRSITSQLAAGAGGEDADEVLFRLWLVPLALPGADVMATTDGDAEAVRFESHVQVMTENMVRQGGLLVGTGARSPIAEATASDFTARYDALASEVPVLGRLATVFELGKLAALLRARGVDHPALDALARRSVALGVAGPADEPRPPWRGIGPIAVAGTDRVVGGGAQLRHRIRPRGIAGSDALQPLIDAARARSSGPVALTLPAVLDLTTAAAEEAAADLALREAVARVREGDPARALAHLDRALAIDDANVDALVLRAILRHAVDAPGALEDAARAAAIDPRQAALRAMLAAGAEDSAAAAGALTEAARVAARYPDDAQVQLVATLAHLEAADLDGAARRFEGLVKVAPFDEATRHVEALLALLLHGVLSRDEARTRLALMRDVPFAIQQGAKAGAELIDRDPIAATRRLEDALALAEASAEPAVRALGVPERVRLMLVLARYRALGADRAWEGDARERTLAAARADAEALVAAHPERAGGHVARMLVADAAGEPEARLVGHLRAAVAAGGADPVLSELGVVMQAERPAVLLGLMTAWGLATSGRGGRELMAVGAQALGDRPIAATLRAASEQRAFDLPVFLERRGRWEDAGRDELVRALGALRAIVAATPSEAQPDAVAAWYLSLVFKAYLPLEQEIGEPARVIEGAVRYLRATTRIAPRSPFAEQVLALRAGATSLVAAAIGEIATASMRTRGEGLEVHATALERAGPTSDPAVVRVHLDALAEGMEALARDARAGVAAELTRLERADASARPLVTLLLALQQRSIGREMPPELVASLRAIPGVDGSSELARLLAATRATRDGLFVTETPAALIPAVSRRAAGDRIAAETALRALEQLRGWLESEGSGAGAIGPEVARVVAELRARVRLGAFVRETGGAAPGSGEGGDGGTGWFPFALGGAVAVLAAGLWLLVRRAR